MNQTAIIAIIIGIVLLLITCITVTIIVIVSKKNSSSSKSSSSSSSSSKSSSSKSSSSSSSSSKSSSSSSSQKVVSVELSAEKSIIDGAYYYIFTATVKTEDNSDYNGTVVFEIGSGDYKYVNAENSSASIQIPREKLYTITARADYVKSNTITRSMLTGENKITDVEMNIKEFKDNVYTITVTPILSDGSKYTGSITFYYKSDSDKTYSTDSVEFCDGSADFSFTTNASNSYTYSAKAGNVSSSEETINRTVRTLTSENTSTKGSVSISNKNLILNTSNLRNNYTITLDFSSSSCSLPTTNNFYFESYTFNEETYSDGSYYLDFDARIGYTEKGEYVCKENAVTMEQKCSYQNVNYQFTVSGSTDSSTCSYLGNNISNKCDVPFTITATNNDEYVKQEDDEDEEEQEISEIVDDTLNMKELEFTSDDTTAFTFKGMLETKPTSWSKNFEDYEEFKNGEYVTEGYYGAFTRKVTIKNVNVTGTWDKIDLYESIAEINMENTLLPDNTIGDGAFENCSNLESITIPDSVTSIGNSAFKGCSKLSSITMPDSLISIGDSAFENCDTNWGYYISITIPDSVTSIGNSAFKGWKTLSSITIPDSVTNIGNSAFENCSSLKSITIPDSGIIIGDSAFKGCSKLESITIPDSVASISDNAFENCSKITSITTTGNMMNNYLIGKYATNEKNITIPSDDAYYKFSGYVNDNMFVITSMTILNN